VAPHTPLLASPGVTAATVAGATAFVRVKGVDLARTSGFLAIASWSFLAALVVGAFTHSSALSIALAAVGAVLFTAYLLHDLQLVMGGSSFVTASSSARGGGMALDPDDAVMASLIVYMDVVSIFIQVLQLVQAAQDRG
jgi:FtsH-binding integral membrane protein